MWKLKYIYRHDDCIYTPMVEKFKVILYGYPINNYVKGKYIYISAIHVLEGENENIKSYVAYLKKISYKSDAISMNAYFTLIRVSKNKEYYKLMYNPHVFYSAPIIHKDGREYVEISSWDREPLNKIILSLKKSRNTEMFKLLLFKKEKLQNIFLVKNIEKMTDKQRRVFELAKNFGYYSYPRKINLDSLAKIMKTTKSTVHETLRRAESNILKQI